MRSGSCISRASCWASPRRRWSRCAADSRRRGAHDGPRAPIADRSGFLARGVSRLPGPGGGAQRQHSGVVPAGPAPARGLPDTLSVSEIESLLASPQVGQPLAWRDRALLELGYGAGLRVSELCGLTIPNLLLADNLLRVFGKGGKERLVPIGRSVIGAVSVYLHTIRPTLDRGKS